MRGRLRGLKIVGLSGSLGEVSRSPNRKLVRNSGNVHYEKGIHKGEPGKASPQSLRRPDDRAEIVVRIGTINLSDRIGTLGKVVPKGTWR